MAFGFGFNKQKVLSAAEKFVQQGKLPNAIAEYEKILKADPKDLTVSNTVGDLYARLGQNDKAIECFKSVGDAYATQGFTVKAIAMYKKLSKLKPTLESVLRLAELYTQQGLFNDARAQYLQVAEEFLRTGELEQAVRIFQKTLEMDPENVAMRMRLAEVYIRLGKKTEAWQIFASAAESLRARGALPQAEEILQRMLTLDPGNSYALLLRGRNAFDSGDIAQATQTLEKVADLDSHPDGLRLLLQCYLQTGRYPEAGTLAAKLFTVHSDNSAIGSYCDALMSAGQYEEALEIYKKYAERLLAMDSAKVLDTLHSLIGHLREDPAALENLLDLFNKAGDNTHLTEVYELLAHAYVQSGHLDKARDYYLKLTQLEPENQLHARNYQQMMAKLGGTPGSRLITAEEGAIMTDELEATAPFIDQRYPDEVALAVRAALTDAELFVSYNMPAKALGPLLSVLPKAPQDLRLNQRLAALHTRAERFTEAAVCCRTLEGIYHDAGHPDEATRYGELASKYEERAVAAGEAPAKIEIPAVAQPEISASFEVEEEVERPVTPAPKAPPVFFHASAPTVKPAASEPAEFEVEVNSAVPAEAEADLSSEWEGAFSDETSAEPAVAASPAFAAQKAEASSAAVSETIEEIRFYLQHSMVEQARDAMAKLERQTSDAGMLDTMRQEIEAATLQAPAEEAIEEVSLEPVETIAELEAEPQPEPEPQIQPEPEPEMPVAAAEPAPGVLDSFVNDLESSLGDNFMPAAPAPVQVPEPEPVSAEPAYAEATAEPVQAGALGEFVADLEASLGDSFLPEAPAPLPQAPRVAEVPLAAPARAAAPQVAAKASAAAASASAAPAMAPPSAAPGAPTFTYQPTKIRPLGTAAAAAVPAPSAAPAVDPSAGVDLADMFGDLKHELEEDVASADEDPETHYNLGVAFREMGLLDEAIGELQKVCQAVERGHRFPQIMQTYTWLAQCFLDKGVPEAAIRWYESALKLPDLDQDTRMALHYELGSSYEAAGNKASALQHFMDVYGTNIDYRDVAERIKALKS